ncbi:MAG: hypothetical protein CMJ45_08675 [Planctomyces sp.]|nr:hypothetical protein [Planctomyces sp.]
MVKVSISLPSNAQITVESQEQSELLEIVGMLRGLSRDLMHSSTEALPDTNGSITQVLDTEKGSSVEPSPSVNGDTGTPAPPPEAAPAQAQEESVVEASSETPETPETPRETPEVLEVPEAPRAEEVVVQPPLERPQESAPVGRVKAQQAARSAAAELAFVQFCQSLNPLGDMRKVVAAAEGAAQFLEMDSVDADDLARLFEQVGWMIPHSFTQTLRNAARSKFRWLERVPGRSGHYMVTTVGRAVILGE